MKNVSWENINSITNEEITYLLYTEGKDIKTISLIRNIDKSEVERHIIECKIKYRAYEGNNNTEDIVKKLIRYTREERSNILNNMLSTDKDRLEQYALERLFNSNREECNFYIWLLGELKSKNAVPKLVTFLKCTDGNVKRMCCSALGKIGDIGAEDGLIGCIRDSRPQVREYAIKALGKLKSRKALSQLKEVEKNKSEKEYILRAAAAAIEQIESKGEADD